MSLQRLLRMIHWQPTGGQLFTAQTPLFAVFVAGVVAYRPQDRLDVERWFKGTMDGSRGVCTTSIGAQVRTACKLIDHAECQAAVGRNADALALARRQRQLQRNLGQ